MGHALLTLLKPAVAALALSVATCDLAKAQEHYPTRPIEMIVGYPAGGGGDIVARLLANAAEPILGQRVIVINKPGASGTVGQQLLAQAKPDGYTIGLIVNLPTVVMPHVTALSYGPGDFAAISQITEGQIVFCSRPDFPATDGKQLVAYARERPDQLTYAGDGVGGSAQILGERLFQPLGIKLRLIPYKGAAESVTALLSQQVDLYGGSVPPVLPFLASGRIKCLLLTSKERSDALPGVMSARDLGIPDQGGSIWHGIAAPPKTSRERVAVLERAFREAAKLKETEKKLQDMGYVVVASSSEDFAKDILRDSAIYREIVKKLALEPPR